MQFNAITYLSPHFRDALLTFLCLAWFPTLAWSACEAPLPHMPRERGWCFGLAGNADADYSGTGMPNEFFMAERRFSGAFFERHGHNRQFLLGLDYGYRNYDPDEPFGPNLDLYTLTLEPQWVVQGDKREWLLRLGLSRATSSNRNTHADVKADELFAAITLVTRQPLGPRQRLVLGVAHDQLFGGAHTYPLAGLETSLNSQWQLGLVLPAPYARWRGQSRWSGQIYLQPAGSRWFVLDGNSGREFEASARDMRLSGMLRRRLGRRWEIEGTLGISFNRSLSTRAGDGRLVSGSLDTAPFGALSLHHRPHD
ncbi:MAG: hypothetical protein OER80_12820 [Gammaproteobacteria bacterium]|nr:hypothetical protein [Gammaproteobacteria bacterium]MDH3768641.1 hypothetical protein [Gammaproteobacteria bacterium]